MAGCANADGTLFRRDSLRGAIAQAIRGDWSDDDFLDHYLTGTNGRSWPTAPIAQEPARSSSNVT